MRLRVTEKLCVIPRDCPDSRLIVGSVEAHDWVSGITSLWHFGFDFNVKSTFEFDD
jgi:hypothetical protein